MHKAIKTIVFLFIVPFVSHAQSDNTPKQDFRIAIMKIGNEVKMECFQGCSFNNLSYNVLDKEQAINNNGMTDMTNKNSGYSDDYQDFFFTISKTADGLSLKGMEGTAWKTLDFTLKPNQKVWINSEGIID